MNERVVRELERTFGSASVSLARARFDSQEVPLFSPTTTEGFCEALALAQREHWIVVPMGSGSKLSWTRAPTRVDLLLSTRGYAGVQAYEPGDGTLTARAGSTMAELAARVALGGHALTPDVPRPKLATLGGVIAAAQSGSDRLRYGPVRDHVLGVQVVLGDGTLARSGGRLVKNVTGYDLQRLFTGSHGSLCVILEASMRLFALPEDECVSSVVVADRADMLRLSSVVLDAPLRPISLSATRLDPAQQGGEWTVRVRLGGRREVLADERATLTRIWPACSVMNGSEAISAAEAWRDMNFGEIEGPLLRVDVRPAAFAKAVELVASALNAPDSARTSSARWWCEPGLARIDVALHDVAHLSRELPTLRANLAPLGGRARVLHAPADFPGDPLIEPPLALALMRSIQNRLDPGGVFASGRTVEAR